MSDTFDQAFNLLMGEEGALNLDPEDKGNWTGGERGMGELKGTKYGISAASYPDLDIRNLTEEDARAIYLKDFWNLCRCGDMPPSVALLVFDAAVNASQRKAAMWLQQALKVQIDGNVGTLTIATLKTLRDVKPVLIDMLAFRNEHNRRSEKADRYGLGWSRRLFTLAFQSIYFNH